MVSFVLGVLTTGVKELNEYWMLEAVLELGRGEDGALLARCKDEARELLRMLPERGKPGEVRC